LHCRIIHSKIMENEQLLIDIEKIIKSKSPFLAKILPKFVIRYIKRIIHVDEVNNILTNYGHEKGVDFVNATLNDLNVSYTIKGIENIDNSLDSRFIFASNHPLGALDGLVLMSAIGKHFNNNVKFVVNDILMNLKPLEPIFVPVNKHGRQTVDYMKQTNDAYSSDSQILYFPAGLCSRKIKGKIIGQMERSSEKSAAIRSFRFAGAVFFVQPMQTSCLF